MSAGPTSPTAPLSRRLARAIPEPGPGRVLYAATFVSTVGTGLYFTSSALFFVACVGLSAASVGLGLTLGGVIGLLAGLPVGRLADRQDPRTLYVVSLLCEGAAMLALVFVHTFWAFAVTTTIAGLAATSTNVARGPLIRAAAPDGATVLRAHLRSVANLGITVGGTVGGVVIAINRPSLYPLLVIGNALSFVLCALLAARLPATSRSTAQKEAARSGPLRAVRDLPYLALTGITAVMMLQYPVLSLALPLWITQHTSLPHWLVAVTLPVNTLMVAALQVRFARGVNDNRSAARLMPRAGTAFLAGFALIAVIGRIPAWLGALLLVAAVVLYTVGEILQGTASYELSLNLAPPEAQGEYLGVYTTGTQLGRVVSASVVTYLCLDLGSTGWVLLGLLMLGAALPTARFTRHAEETRKQPPPLVGPTTA
ncbi:MFS transporter [Streptomyces sp. TLI_55]|uniref:MFS transporter n=1 Tax=Streptomyces sp. TLI_55 TaxID=1938861 RepID=UPI000BD64FB8|nr:MFS transporter [Streptomyces sp. TLI_55]SNX88548.1 MFS transporter [Streptomyces sp. TLI_55]